MKDLIHGKLMEIELILNRLESVSAYEYVEWMNEKAMIKYNNRWYHIDLEAQNSTVLIEQLRNISKLRIIASQRLRGNLCKINNSEWEKINEALKKFYCMTPLK